MATTAEKMEFDESDTASVVTCTMRVYKQTSLLTQLLKIGLGLEIGFLGVSYLLFRRLNESPEKRYEYRNYPFLLECYYKIDESLGHGERRRSDQEHWKKHFQGK